MVIVLSSILISRTKTYNLISNNRRLQLLKQKGRVKASILILHGRKVESVLSLILGLGRRLRIIIKPMGGLSKLTSSLTGWPPPWLTLTVARVNMSLNVRNHISKTSVLFERRSRKDIVILLGHMNVRIERRLEHKHQVLGYHIFGKGIKQIGSQRTDTHDSRQLFIHFCIDNDLVVMNSRFPKPAEKLITYKEISTQCFASPWTADRFTAPDLILLKDRWNDCCPNVESKIDCSLNSDHALVIATIRIKLGKQIKTQRWARSCDTTNQTKNNLQRTIVHFLTLIIHCWIQHALTDPLPTWRLRWNHSL